MLPRIVRLLAILAAAGIVGVALPAGASVSTALDGTFSTTFPKPSFTGQCPSGVADECGTIQLAGLGAADWTYTFGPTFDPDGSCFDVDGTFTLTLQADRSTISGPLTGVFCPRPSETAHNRAGAISYGTPFVETDTVDFGQGTGAFEGLTGVGVFSSSGAGTHFQGTLSGTLHG